MKVGRLVTPFVDGTTRNQPIPLRGSFSLFVCYCVPLHPKWINTLLKIFADRF